MKTSLKTVLFAALAAFGVPAAFAAPESHEEFARQYMPESQALFERFRKDCAETKKLRDALAEDLRVMNRPMLGDAGYFALCVKIEALEQREAEWMAQIKDAFFKHKAAMATSEQLAAADAELAKKSLAWENDALKPMLKKIVSELLYGVLVTVRIPGQPYAFGRYEVTQAQYEAVMGKNPSRFKGMDLPVECVSYRDAVAFCEKLTARERASGRISVAQRYRLPTSEEWKHACHAGTTTQYYTGDSETDLERAGWYEGNSGGKTHPVGQKEPNAFGLYDMHGNVEEWTSSGYIPSSRLIMGGNWDSHWCYCADPKKMNTEYSNGGLGFRVVLDPAE